MNRRMAMAWARRARGLAIRQAGMQQRHACPEAATTNQCSLTTPCMQQALERAQLPW